MRSTDAATPPAVLPADPDDLARLGAGAHATPHAVLGAHPHDGGVTVRTLRPLAESVAAVLPDGSRHALAHEAHGVWAGALPVAEVTDYRLEVAYAGPPGRRWSTTRTGSCPRSARSTGT